MKKLGLLVLAVLSVSSAFSQTTATVPASALHASPALAPAQVITLGDSVAPLTGPWKFSPGDSPWVNGEPVWAQPGFDDSKWAAMGMTPKAGSVDILTGASGYLPGWTRRGYPNLDGYAWYRLRLRIADHAQPLWLKMPSSVDDAYQVYANGRYVGEFGRFSPHSVAFYYSESMSFPLPAPGPDGEIALAVRFYMSPSTSFQSPDVGGMHGPPALGLASTVRLLRAADGDAGVHRNFGLFLRTFLFLLIAPLALWAWLKNRQESAWLWLFLAVACSIVYSIVIVVGSQTTWMTIASNELVAGIVLGSLLLSLWTMFWWYWFGLRGKHWIPRALWLLTAAKILTTFLVDSPDFGLSFLPQVWLSMSNYASTWCGAAQGILLLIILVEGFRRDRTEALLAALPILLLELSSFGEFFLTTFDIPFTFYPFGLGIGVGNAASVLMVLVIVALALRRFVRTQVREELARQVIHQDLEQAQQLQQRVLVPEALHSPHFTVETEYRPAQTVGGDFFQTLTKPDGSLLVVIGDVSGKGISAAMLVAVLVGTIRNQAKQSFDPAAMLTMLNESLMGRSGGHFATCVVAEILPDGKMRMANAGHLPPYRNGKEMELEGSLPLGVIGEAEYFAQTIMLQPGDRLTFMTDGVVEATNPEKDLFGFARTQAISGESAAAIAQEAQTFGQEDDITVLRVEYSLG